jgi:glucose-6-phosphate isomerase
LPQLTPAAVGYLIHTLEIATLVSGCLYNIDPLDQPGVELGKKFTYGLMGRKGFESFKSSYTKGLAARKKYIVK